MRWTAAWFLALAVHIAAVAVVWLVGRTLERPRPATVPDTVEVAMLDRDPREDQARAPRVLEAAPVTDQHRAVDRQLGRARERLRAAERRPAPALPSASASASASASPPAPSFTPAPPAAPAVIALGAARSMLDLRPRAEPPAASPVAPGVDLRLRRDPSADLAPSAKGAGAATETSALRGEIARDGSMRIRPKAPVSLGSDLLAPGAVLNDWLKDPKKHAAERDGTVAIVSGRFDVTDSIMRAAGQDPYRAQRMKMLDDTREQRLALAARDRSVRQAGELAALPGALRNIWNDGARSAEERRRIIFQLWDECQEPTEGEGESTAAGAHARRVIVLFIRSQVGEGSRHAYPKEELAALNLTRQSRQRFDPYGRSPL